MFIQFLSKEEAISIMVCDIEHGRSILLVDKSLYCARVYFDALNMGDLFLVKTNSETYTLFNTGTKVSFSSYYNEAINCRGRLADKVYMVDNANLKTSVLAIVAEVGHFSRYTDAVTLVRN